MSLWRRTDHPTSLMSRTTGELSIQDIFRDSPVVLSSDVAKPPGRGRCLVHVLATWYPEFAWGCAGERCWACILGGRVHDQLPQSGVLSTQAWYTIILVLMVGIRLYQTLIAGRAMIGSCLPICLLSSTSMEGLLQIVESRYVEYLTTDRWKCFSSVLTSWTTILVVFRLIVKLKSLHTRAKQLMNPWSASSECAHQSCNVCEEHHKYESLHFKFNTKVSHAEETAIASSVEIYSVLRLAEDVRQQQRKEDAEESCNWSDHLALLHHAHDEERVRGRWTGRCLSCLHERTRSSLGTWGDTQSSVAKLGDL